jgi:hypothetical protein
MYTIVNGQKTPITYSFEEYGSPVPVVGSNKELLIGVFIISIVAVGISGYLLFKNMYKPKGKIGYQLY